MLTLIIFWLANANGRGTSRERRHNDHVPYSVVAVAFMMALGTLAICLFWPYLLPLGVTPREVTAAPHSALSFRVLGAGALVFLLMLLFTTINYAMSRRRPRPCEVIDAFLVVKDETARCCRSGSPVLHQDSSKRPQSQKRDRRHHGNDSAAVV